MKLPVIDSPRRRRWQQRYPVKTDVWPRIPCPHCGRDIAVSPTGKASSHGLPELGPDESACLHGCCCIDNEQFPCPQSGQKIEGWK